MKKRLPIGTDEFRKVREQDRYYVDKTMLIKEIIESNDDVILITRPRRFGKTLNMTMLREFFDITVDSMGNFNGLAIMGTEYSRLINSRPVIYFSFKDCKENTIELFKDIMNNIICNEYKKHYRILKGTADENDPDFYQFFMLFEKLLNNNTSISDLKTSIDLLLRVLYLYYKIEPIIIIDEYDQPIVSSFEYGYHEQLTSFFSGFYGMALKGQGCLHQAILTGIQRVVKESIFSQLNNVSVYTVVDEEFSEYFGLNTEETKELLCYYGLTLDESVKQKYDGYLFYKTEMYNPWSIVNYAKRKKLECY